MDVNCNSPVNACQSAPCPVVLDSVCVFYEGANLIYTGINTNDTLQLALQKIDAKFADASIGYIFNNGIIQVAPGDPVQLGGSLIQNTTISGNYRLTFQGSLESSRFVTTGGTINQVVAGDGTLLDWDGGTSGTSGTHGTSGSSGSSGTAGTSGTSGRHGSSGTSATAGTGGTSGRSGTSGTSGSAGTSASSGTSGSAGTSASSGSSGRSGTSGTSASSGSSGTSGSSGLTGDRYKSYSNDTFTLGNGGTLQIEPSLAFTSAQNVLIAYDFNNYQISTIASYDNLTGLITFVAPGPDRKSTRLNSSHIPLSRMPSSA